MNIGTTELIVILALALFLYGKRLPEITRALGRGYRAFRENIDGIKNDLAKEVKNLALESEIKEIDKIYQSELPAPDSSKADKTGAPPVNPAG